MSNMKCHKLYGMLKYQQLYMKQLQTTLLNRTTMFIFSYIFNKYLTLIIKCQIICFLYTYSDVTRSVYKKT